MQSSAGAWLVILLALVAANLPFMNERVFAGLRWRHPVKPIWLRLAELIVLYFVVGALATVFESRLGNVAPQGWEFYAITACLFLVLGFPGFVYRYLLRRR